MYNRRGLLKDFVQGSPYSMLSSRTIVLCRIRRFGDGAKPNLRSSIVEAVPAANSILVVEDDPAVRKLLYMTLSKNGYGVECAADGDQALTHLTKPGEPIALILLC